MNRRPSQSRSGYDSFSPQHTAHFRADQPDGDFFDPKPPKSLRRRVLLILLALILAILLINVAVNQFVRVERVTVPIRKMDAAFEGYTLLHISDLKGLLYFTDGWGTYPKHRPPYDVAFLFFRDQYQDTNVPPWAMKVILGPEELTEVHPQ